MSVKTNEEYYDWAQTIFDRLGLDLSEVLHRSFLLPKSLDAKLAISMASIDKRLELTDEEHAKMANFLEAIK